MHPSELFRHCPGCGAARAENSTNPLQCAACGFTYFFSPAAAAGAFIFDAEDRALFIRRAKEPRKGTIAIPGGFIDVGESAEEGLRREVREEVGIEVEQLTFLGSCPNDYPFEGVTYPVVDVIFTARAVDPEAARSLGEVDGLMWRALDEVDPDEFAFPSLRMGWERLRERG
jgi:ADP-ribose pyrophosphatase YjhB (NUDIX family)